MRFEFVVEDESVQKSIGRAVVQQFSAVGVKAMIDVVDGGAAFERRASAGRAAIPMWLWFWAFPNPIDLLLVLGGSQIIGRSNCRTRLSHGSMRPSVRG